MLSQNTHIAKNAQDALKQSVRQQEECKRSLLKEQNLKELKQVETKLYYKQQEITRMKAQMDKMKREFSLSKSTSGISVSVRRGVNSKIRQIQNHLIEVQKDFQTKLDLISKKLSENQTLLGSKNNSIKFEKKIKDSFEQSMKTLSQEVVVLENKIKAIKVIMR